VEALEDVVMQRFRRLPKESRLCLENGMFVAY